MVTMGAYEAKTHLPRLLERVAKGERIVITKHGVPVAELAPVRAEAHVDRDELVAQIRAFGKGRSAGGPLRELIEEGRR